MTDAIIMMGGLGCIIGICLAIASRIFYVYVDPKVEAITDALPGANCGGCGFVGCGEYAEAIVNDGAPIVTCAPGGTGTAAAIAAIMGVEVTETAPKRAVIHCGATADKRLGRGEYLGEKSCAAAANMAGVQACTFGCLGLGDCVAACDYDAIHIENGLATVDYMACVGCNACARACPRQLISMIAFNVDRLYAITCSNKEGGKEVKAVCTTGCIACKACTKKCDLITMEGKLPEVDYANYTADRQEEMAAAAEKCPTDSIEMVG